MNDRISILVKRLSPQAVCISCIGESLQTPDAPDLAMTVFEMVGQHEFESDRGTCSLCNQSRRIVRHRPRALQH